MRRVIYSMTVSADGFTAGPGGEIDWSAPDEELHRFHNERVRELTAHLCGRRLYETMLYWETAEATGSDDPVVREFAAIWQALPRIVFSSTLSAVEGNSRLATRDIEEELAALDGDVGVGGPGLAAECARRGLIDEYQLFISPVILGGGTRFLPPLDARVPLELLESRTFGSRVVYLRFARAV